MRFGMGLGFTDNQAGGGTSLPTFAAGAKIITVGDSITQYGNYADGSPHTKVSNRGTSIYHQATRDIPAFKHGIWYDPTATFGAAPPLFRGSNFGGSGESPAEIYDRITPMINSGASAALLMCGTNYGDPAQTVEESKASILQIVTALTGAGMHVFFMTILPRDTRASPTGGEISTARWLQLEDINAYIGTLAASNVTVIDTTTPLLDPAYTLGDANYGSPLAGMTKDGVHPSALGAYTAGQVVRTVLRQTTGTDLYDDTWFNSDPTDAGNFLLDGELSGTGGATGNGTSGTVPQYWSVFGESATGAVTGVCSVAANANTGGQSLTIALTSDGSKTSSDDIEAVYMLPQAWRVNEPGMTDGKYYQMFVKVNVGASSILPFVRAELRNTTTGITGHANEHSITARGTYGTVSDAWEGWLQTEAVQYNTSDVFGPRIYMDVRDDIAGSATVRIDACLILEVSNPQDDYPYYDQGLLFNQDSNSMYIPLI
jgi:lysophospholipase L1-like esterase